MTLGVVRGTIFCRDYITRASNLAGSEKCARDEVARICDACERGRKGLGPRSCILARVGRRAAVRTVVEADRADPGRGPRHDPPRAAVGVHDQLGPQSLRRPTGARIQADPAQRPHRPDRDEGAGSRARRAGDRAGGRRHSREARCRSAAGRNQAGSQAGRRPCAGNDEVRRRSVAEASAGARRDVGPGRRTR